MAEYIERGAVLNILAGKNAPWDGYQKVSELPAADVQPVKWIPVTERLPKKHQYVLVTYNGLDGSRLVVVTNWNPNTWIESNSVAWMPVPEPYEGGQK